MPLLSRVLDRQVTTPSHSTTPTPSIRPPAMEALLQHAALKPFHTFLAALGRLGTELAVSCAADGVGHLVHRGAPGAPSSRRTLFAPSRPLSPSRPTDPEQLALATTNQSHSAYGRVQLERGFFAEYACRAAPSTSPSSASAPAPPLLFKVAVKPVIAIFRKLEAVESVRMSLDEVADRLVLLVHCRMGVVKTHSLRLIQVLEHFEAARPTSYDYQFRASARIISSWLSHFPPKLDEVTLLPRAASLCLTSFREAEAGGTAPPPRSLTTELIIDFLDLDSIHIPPTGPPPEGRNRITFSLRDFKTSLGLSEALSVPLQVQFERPGQPLCLMAGTPTWDFLLLLATMEGPPGIELEERPSIAVQPSPEVPPAVDAAVTVTWALDPFEEEGPMGQEPPSRSNATAVAEHENEEVDASQRIKRPRSMGPTDQDRDGWKSTPPPGPDRSPSLRRGQEDQASLPPSPQPAMQTSRLLLYTSTPLHALSRHGHGAVPGTSASQAEPFDAAASQRMIAEVMEGLEHEDGSGYLDAAMRFDEEDEADLGRSDGSSVEGTPPPTGRAKARLF